MSEISAIRCGFMASHPGELRTLSVRARRPELLDRPFPSCLIHLHKLALRILSDDLPPEHLRLEVLRLLMDAPYAGEQAEDPPGRLPPDAPPPVLAEDEELGERVRRAAAFLQCPHEREAGQPAARAHEVGVAPRPGPVVVQIAVAKQPVFVDFLAVELAVVVLSQLHEVA